MQKTQALKEIQLQTPAKPTEDTSVSPKAPKLTHTPVWVRTATDLKEGGEIHRVEQLSQDDGLISTKDAQEPKSLTEITVEVNSLSSDGADIEMACMETTAQVEKEVMDSYTNDKKTLEKESQQTS